jgi:uncharacterized membrane protein YdjX (TVP38/TMEM64 family)
MAARAVLRPIAIVRIVVLALLVAFAAYALFFAAWRPRSLQDVQDSFSDVGPFAPFLAILIQTVAVILFVPGFLLILGTSLIFGRESIWISLVGQTLGASVCFFIARFVGRDYLRSLLGPRVVNIERILEEHGLKYLVYMRFLGIVPLPLVSYGPGLVHMRFRLFLLATVIGESPLIIVLGLFGTSLAAIRHVSDVWDFEFLFPAALLVVLYTVPMMLILIIRRYQRRKATALDPGAAPAARAARRR